MAVVEFGASVFDSAKCRSRSFQATAVHALQGCFGPAFLVLW